MDPNSNGYCEVCDKNHGNVAGHNSSATHRFNFKLWEYNTYRKAIVADRHGIGIRIDPQAVQTLSSHSHNKRKGCHIVEILTRQLISQNCKITFSCTITNERNDSIYITSCNLLHPTEMFTLIQENLEDDAILDLEPKSKYKLSVQFHARQLTIGSFKVPITFNFQTRNKYAFTIGRAIVIHIIDVKEKKEENTVSPFTSKSWLNVSSIEPPKQPVRYIDEYPVPQLYSKLLRFGLKEFSTMIVEEENTLKEIQKMLGKDRKVTLNNYKDFWHIMLWMEEVVHSMMLQNYNMENVTIAIKNSDILVLEVPGLAEKRPSVIPSDLIQMRVHNDHKAYTGIVKRILDKSVEIYYVHDEFLQYLKQYPKMEVDVQFRMNRMNVERMHKGIDQVVMNGMVPSLFPGLINLPKTHNNYQLRDSDFCNKEILANREQMNAVIKIVNNNEQYPYIVFGPPGTGKTITIVEAIIQIKRLTNKKILVCAPANSACDMITTKLMEFCSKNELIRINSETRDRSTLTGPLMEYSNMNDSGDFTKLTAKETVRYRIVVTTLMLIGRYKGRYRPDYVFVDEAAQAAETETAVPMGILQIGGKVVLAGDPKQLGPIAVSYRAKKYGLGTSLLERLMNFHIYQSRNDNFITMLKLNFRSHPEILHIPNELFYGNELKPIALAPRNDPLVNIAIYPKIMNQERLNARTGHALEFCAVSAKERREGYSPSYFNPAEVAMVAKYVKALINLDLGSQHKITEDHIGIVTPYKRQVYKIKEALKEINAGEVEVSTTEGFQGREKRIIIISTVRAQHSLLLYDRRYDLGFVKNEKRFNVAVTRAISKLILIGCPAVLITSSMWLKMIEHCEALQTYFGPRYQRRDDDFKNGVLQRMKNFRGRDNQYHKS